MNGTPYAPLFELVRGNTVESLHYGAIAVVEVSGRLAAWWGDPKAITYLRSSAKPFQAIPFLEDGGQAYYDLSQEEIAILCASHSGTDRHVAVVEQLQAKTGVRQAELLCGIHPLTHKATLDAMRDRGEELTPNRHNCSGKHTGMLAYARMLGLPQADYINPEHPIQQRIRHTFAEFCGLPVDQVAVGVDGCSAPNFAVPLYNAALAFARLCDPLAGSVSPPARTKACATVVQAMMAHPFMVGGPDSFDTRLMEATQGRLICKGGAEGYQAMGLLPGAIRSGSPAMGIVLKVSDGDLEGHNRPAGEPKGTVRPAVAIEILRQLGVLTPGELEALSPYGPTFRLLNWRKLIVGLARPCFELKRGFA